MTDLRETVARALAAADRIEICSDASYSLSTYGPKADAAIAAMQPAIAQARREALEEAVRTVIDNQDCDPWEIAISVRALIEKEAK